MTEQTRGSVGNDEHVGIYWPDHFAPMTWLECLEADCHTRVDPWDHQTRCPEHRHHHAEDLMRVRELVAAGRRTEQQYRR